MEKPKLTINLKKLKKDQILIGLLAGLLLLIIALPHDRETSEEQESSQTVQSETREPEDTAAQLERKLQKILEQVQGVGKVQVMITVKSSGKKTVEKDRSISEDGSGGEDGQSKRTEESTVYQRDSQGNEIPFVTEEASPVIEGVLVAAQGGDNLSVVENISEAAMVLFGVEAHKIKVMKLN